MPCVVASWLSFTTYALATVSLPILLPGTILELTIIPSLLRRSINVIFPSSPLSQNNMSSIVQASRLSYTAYECIVFIALKKPFFVEYLMFVVCIVATDIDPNLMMIQYFWP